MNGSIQHRPDRPSPWKAKYYKPDGRQHSKSFKTKREAQQWLRSELARLDSGRWTDPAAGRIAFCEWATTWLATLDIKPKTRASYESILRSRINPALGHRQIASVAPGDIRTLVTEMNDAGLSPSRTRQALHIVRASLEQAVADGLIARNPARHVKAPTARPREAMFLTAPQVAALTAEAEQRQAGAGELVRFLAYSGVRWGEAVALQRADVDPLRGLVHIRRAATEINGTLVFGTPKNHRTRTLVLPRFVALRLADHLTRTGGGPDDLVFTAPHGGPLRVSNFRSTIWLPATAALDLRGLRVHDLRHTAASLAISAGASIKAVQRMLGHSSVTITLDRYSHLYQDDLEALARTMDDRYATADTEVA